MQRWLVCPSQKLENSSNSFLKLPEAPGRSDTSQFRKCKANDNTAVESYRMCPLGRQDRKYIAHIPANIGKARKRVLFPILGNPVGSVMMLVKRED